MVSFNYNGHTISLKDDIWVKRIFYDGREMASRGTMWGASDMFFTVVENNETVTYELETQIGFFIDKFIVKRNGVIIYSD